MKTFFVVVKEKRVRAVTQTKGVIVAENADKAVELVKSFYPPGATGWKADAIFEVKEIPENTFFPY